MEAEQKTLTLTVRLTPSLRDLLERVASRDGRTMSDLARKVIADWLRKQEKRT